VSYLQRSVWLIKKMRFFAPVTLLIIISGQARGMAQDSVAARGGGGRGGGRSGGWLAEGVFRKCLITSCLKNQAELEVLCVKLLKKKTLHPRKNRGSFTPSVS
ncbi:MAG: hypothetical protein ACK5RS_00290, partial [Acidobacteriota bacterium]